MVTNKKKIDAKGLFMQNKPAGILLYIKKQEKPLFTSVISKEANITYAHTFNVLKKLEELKLVYFKQSGRLKLIKLTELGEEVAKTILSLEDLLSLAELENEAHLVYNEEIKGKLREDMNKEHIISHLSILKEKIAVFQQDKPYNVLIMSQKLVNRIDDILTEALGYPQG